VTTPLVSVALATWNGARYLRQQLDSVYAQTWPNLEVVATDDASTDGTAAILQEYA
jgi:glycosyltransferase involved in cell wall biosynthesis